MQQFRALIAGPRDSTQIQPEERASEFCAPFAHEIVSGPISYE